VSPKDYAKRWRPSGKSLESGLRVDSQGGFGGGKKRPFGRHREGNARDENGRGTGVDTKVGLPMRAKKKAQWRASFRVVATFLPEILRP